ncbi:hypothetical protein [Crateriforma conspicua]|uniref:Uncharacterized protein n=1 Tax=Crateriforma conspicua TaxID=2527996 RepID=A0A5C6FU73_9PLAN|nr:hypothetical protein [Crateriforma conspicua]TWU66449.1 hypothetical protein V7x_20150 [Crateriforma conspicua]
MAKKLVTRKPAPEPTTVQIVCAITGLGKRPAGSIVAAMTDTQRESVARAYKSKRADSVRKIVSDAQAKRTHGKDNAMSDSGKSKATA